MYFHVVPLLARAGIAVVVDLNQLPQRIVGVARPLAVQRRTRNVPVVVVAVAAVAPRLGNRRNEVRHAARAVAARREMVFARERLAAQLDRRERRPIQLVNGRRALPDGGCTTCCTSATSDDFRHHSRISSRIPVDFHPLSP